MHTLSAARRGESVCALDIQWTPHHPGRASQVNGRQHNQQRKLGGAPPPGNPARNRGHEERSPVESR
ncbi:hypothetical protein D187_006420 [Cystobacter fuscus DSM 2262]|uniref:Uncharacterized protein n=1 Tax=Cystobacter fuscus (strain ATCC 25194 / DSM 2262 / NBRC 100088 / M29) TaxID=1242864 RepID=S9PF44_CYSF2|nr:hypothetical protein D187_006420 [Cystobacter fuscus DSM 2262]